MKELQPFEIKRFSENNTNCVTRVKLHQIQTDNVKGDNRNLQLTGVYNLLSAVINSLIYESVNKKCSCRVVVGRYHFDEYWLYVSQRFIWTEYRIRLEMLYIYRGLASLMFLEYHKILVLDQNWIFQIINFQVCHNESVSKLKVLMVKVSSEYSNKKYC